MYPTHRKALQVRFHQHNDVNQERWWQETQKTGHPTESCTRNPEDKDKGSQWYTKCGSAPVQIKQVGRLTGKTCAKRWNWLSAISDLPKRQSQQLVWVWGWISTANDWMSVFSKIHMLRPNPQCREVGSLEVIRSWRWSPQDWDDFMRPYSVPFCCVRTEQ